MTMTRAWVETSLSAKEADSFYKEAIVHIGIDKVVLGEGVSLILSYMNSLNLTTGTADGSKRGDKEYPLRIVSIRSFDKVNEYYSRKRQLVSTLDDVPFTDRRVTRKVTVKPMGYAHTAPIPLNRRGPERSALSLTPSIMVQMQI
tara:strand:+ start:1795 stop:2229 length:435 start_codon:yes stop_codon:yes gene_type:complete